MLELVVQLGAGADPGVERAARVAFGRKARDLSRTYDVSAEPVVPDGLAARDLTPNRAHENSLATVIAGIRASDQIVTA